MRNDINKRAWGLWAVALILLLVLTACEMTFEVPVDSRPPVGTDPGAPTASESLSDTAAEPPEDPFDSTADAGDESTPEPGQDTANETGTDSDTPGQDSTEVPTGEADSPSAPEETTEAPSADVTGTETGAPRPPEPCTHTPVMLPGVSPTCTEPGKTEGSICGDCGEILDEPAGIPALGHDYDELLCRVCGHYPICPPPAFAATGDISVPFGRELFVNWGLTETALFDFVYILTVQEDGGEEVTQVSDTVATEYTVNLPHEGVGYTFRLYALYALEGAGVAETRSAPAILRVTVPLRPRLEMPAFITGNLSTAYVGKEITVSWVPVECEATVRYTVTLRSPDGSVILLSESSEAAGQLLGGELLNAEGVYRLTVTAHTPDGSHRDSPEASLEILVKSAEAELEEAFHDPKRYDSDYFYEYLATQEKATLLQLFYQAVDSALTRFHTSTDNAKEVTLGDGSTHPYAVKMDYKIMGLTLEEAISVRFCYMYDHPLYYWLSNIYVYSSTSIYFCVDEAYAAGADRAACNSMIYAGAMDMAEGLYDETSSYRIALAYYERLLATADYAYEADGTTPQDDLWAHSIVGLFDPSRREVVCEGFAEAYSLMLNFHGVENIQVPGVSRNVGHLWNMIQLDNGQWYWCDITWDDKTFSPLGTDYKYFCVTDTQDVLYYYVRDGIEAGYDYSFSGSATFMDDHTVLWDSHISLDMSAAIPARATSPYEGAEPVLRDTFTVDGMEYAIVGYNKVQLVDVGSKGRVTVPESVAFEGHSYTVYSIGLISEDGIYMKGRMLPLFASSVYIPRTVYYVWDKALQGFLVNITVAPENPYYTVVGGVLTRKDSGDP